MKTKVYRVIVIKGRKRNVMFESKPFDATDGWADYAAYMEATEYVKEHCMETWWANSGRLEIERCTK